MNRIAKAAERRHLPIMRISGTRFKATKLVQSDRFVVAVEIEMVIPVADPSEPCYESETINFLREIKDHADRGDLNWLRQHGKVYESLDAA